MKLISLIRKQFGVVDKHAFYSGKALNEVEWWIASGSSRFPDLAWARLRVFCDGSADAAFDESSTYGFDDRKFAGYFLGEDEYGPLATVDANDEREIGAKRSEMSPPSWSDTATKFKYLGTY